jgi:hypothetical protein
LRADLKIDLVEQGLNPKVFADLLQADQGDGGC